jgi:hypothetical protein
MNKLVTKTLNSKKETWIIALGGILFALIGLYLYFLSVSIVHVVIRQEVNQNIKEVNSKIASLESSYITAQHRLSASVATLEGYSKTENKVYINRKASSLVLNTTANER